MNKANEMNDDLRKEYDLKHLQVRRLGPERRSFRGSQGIDVHLEPDVGRVFNNSRAVNEALRFLIRITKENASSLPETS